MAGLCWPMEYDEVGATANKQSAKGCQLDPGSAVGVAKTRAEGCAAQPTSAPGGGDPPHETRRAAFDGMARSDAQASSREGSGLGRVRVLVAHRDNENREMIVRLLARLGCDFEVAVDGQAMIDAAERRRHDLVLMDVPLAAVDGPEAARRIREIEHQRGRRPTLVVGMINHATQDLFDRCLESGMNHCLAHPVGGAELVMVLACAIDAVRTQAAAEGGPGVLPGKPLAHG